MSKQKKSNIKYVVMIVAVILVALLLSVALYFYNQSADKAVVSKEVRYILIAFLVALPVMLILLLLGLIFGKSDYKIDLSGLKANASLSGTAQPVATGKGIAKEEDEEEDRSRFYMLCEIDANRNRYQKT
ncbi:MAG: hypothetical protein E7368_01950, partial [Clostridiales bacterium]|nr:hypothetical protein [Clostridiales bacterium]